MRLIAFLLAVLPIFAESPPALRLVEWERGVAVEPRGHSDRTMFLWFYEWNMFEAMSPGEHTPGNWKLTRRIAPDGRSAVITGPGLRLEMKVVADGAELTIEVTNVSGHDWPELAAIIPCWNPGQKPGSDPTKRAPLNVIFADEERDKTSYVSARGFEILDSRAIHFNQHLRPLLDRLSPQGTFVFSNKWPTSEVNAATGIMIRESADRKWVTGIGWEDYLSVQGHNPWACMHASIRVGPLKRGEKKTVRGRVYLFPGSRSDCLARWRKAFPSPARVGLAPHQEQEWRQQIKTTLFVPDPLPALVPQAHGRFEPAPGVVAERVSYSTQFGMRVPAILYLPKSRPGKVPAFIVVNGHGGDKYSWYAFYSGILYARAGAAVLTYDPAGEGERNIDRKSGTRAHDKVEDPPELARRLAGLMITDVMQAVSFLSQRPEVDPKRIAAAGYSMGSFVLSLACAVDTRLKACVLVGGGNLDGPGGYWDNTKPMCTGRPYQSLLFLGDRAAVVYALHASRGPTLVFNGLEDSTVGIPKHGHTEPFFQDLQRRVAELRGTPAGVFETGFVPGVGHRPFFVTKPVALWLERRLDFPHWTEQRIATMPETHISEWAKQNGVEMDPLYSSEHREGGTPALGAGVPGLPRQELSVFSPEDWERHKSRLIHEQWLEQAKALIVER